MKEYILLTTASCPKCPAVKEFLSEKLGDKCSYIDNTNNRFSSIVSNFSIQQAPCFLVLEEENELFRASEIYEIEEFLNKES